MYFSYHGCWDLDGLDFLQYYKDMIDIENKVGSSTMNEKLDEFSLVLTVRIKKTSY